MRSGAKEENQVQHGGAQGWRRRGTEFERSSKVIFNTSTEAYVAMNMVERAEEREPEATGVLLGTRISFWESESDLNRYRQFCVVV